MLRLKLAVFLMVMVTITSNVFLIKFFIETQSSCSLFNRNRLICLILEHFFFVYMEIRLLKCRDATSYAHWLKWLSLTILSIVTLNEIISTLMNGGKYTFVNSGIEPRLDARDRIFLALWLNLYFQSWLYSLMSLMLLGIVVGIIKLTSYCQRKRRQQYILRRVVHKVYKKEAAHDSEEEHACSICLSQFQESEQVMECPCTHIFHQQCLVNWLQNKNNCPLCREVFF